jgi:SAM-dependent methyltransferase
MLRPLLTLVMLAVAVAYLLRQVRKPGRWIGRPFLWSMNRSHSALTDWGLGHVRIGKGFRILDVGCGGGRTIEKLAALAAEGRVCGVDYAAGSVAASRAHNRCLIAASRVEIREASVSHLPYPDCEFDLVTAVETHYYWPDLPADLREIRRVMKPGGSVVVIAEAYRGGRYGPLMVPAMLPLGVALMSAEQHREWLATAGFADVQIFEEPRCGWICVLGRRPGSELSTIGAHRQEGVAAR